MARRKLNVFLHGQKIGILAGTESEILGFEYEREYSGLMLSHSMPTVQRSVSRQTAANWFDNLLPEGEELRRAMASAHDSRDTSSFGLLKIDGLDCAGSVQITESDELPVRVGQANLINDAEISERLIAARTSQPVGEDSERWSVAGQQGKIALHKTEAGQWARPEEGLPTTHILKPGIPRHQELFLRDQALIEHVTLDAARQLGVHTVDSSFELFAGTPAILVERYDRYWESGICYRIHQEDMCQALGEAPDKKYEENGGPRVAQIADLLDFKATSANLSYVNRIRFAQMVIFNYLSGSSDAHAKNYSLMILDGDESVLAPMYDAASGLAFSNRHGKRRFPRAAMKIGIRDRFGTCTETDWRQFAADLRLDFDTIVQTRDELAGQMVAAFYYSIQEPGIPDDSREYLLTSPMLHRMDEICRHAQGEEGKPVVVDLSASDESGSQ